jgi:hypothetical protein
MLLLMAFSDATGVDSLRENTVKQPQTALRVS